MAMTTRRYCVRYVLLACLACIHDALLLILTIGMPLPNTIVIHYSMSFRDVLVTVTLPVRAHLRGALHLA